jgi:hypothetical protein
VCKESKQAFSKYLKPVPSENEAGMLTLSTGAMSGILISNQRPSIRIKGKVVPVLPLTEHHAMKVYWGVEVQLHPFFESIRIISGNLLTREVRVHVFLSQRIIH